MIGVEVTRTILATALAGSAFLWLHYIVFLHTHNVYARPWVKVLDLAYGVLLVWGAILFAYAATPWWAPQDGDIRAWMQWVLPPVIFYPPYKMWLGIRPRRI